MTLHNSIIHLLLKRAVLPILAGFAFVSVLARLSLLFVSDPPPPIQLEANVVSHQQSSATNAGPRDLLLVGDSSCLMNIAADHFAAQSDLTALNLGMVSIMPLRNFAQLVADHRSAYPGFPRQVILVIHPEMLAQTSEPPDIALEPSTPENESGQFRRTLLNFTGILPSFERTIGTLVPAVLPGRYASFYGFNFTFRQYLHDHHGSAVDPWIAPLPSYEPPSFSISDSFRREAAAFREILPPDATLFLVLSPYPAENSPPPNENIRHEVLQLLGAKALLSVPATLPKQLFSTTTHLRPEYRTNYTHLLFREFVSNSSPLRASALPSHLLVPFSPTFNPPPLFHLAQPRPTRFNLPRSPASFRVVPTKRD